MNANIYEKLDARRKKNRATQVGEGGPLKQKINMLLFFLRSRGLVQPFHSTHKGTEALGCM